YRIEVNNAGPSDAQAVLVAIAFSHAIAHTSAECTPAQGSQISCALVDAVPADSSASITLGLRQLPSAPAVLSSNLNASAQTSDPVPGNNATSSNTIMRSGVDLEVSIDDGLIGFAPG